MRFRTLLVAALVITISSVAFAELQNVEVGGNIRIRGNYYNLDRSASTVRIAPWTWFRTGRVERRQSFIEQRTRLNVKADFTQDVSAFIELDYYSGWGEDFRSNYLTGADFRAGTRNDDVNMYQAYIEAKDMWGAPLTARVGRQELALGSQWLVGTNDVSSLYRGLSFDALRLTFANDMFSLDAVAAKLVETYSDFGDDDVDLYGLYASYIGIEDVTLDAYWLFVRDDQGATAAVIGGDDVNLHTIGLRGAGVVAGFDFDVEAAYQFGSVYGIRNPWFRIFNREADVDFDEFGVNVELGYTFDMDWQPRVFGRFAWLGGGKPNRSWWNNNYDLPFNRLFSNVRYSEFLDINQSLSNAFFYSLGLQVMPTEAIELKLVGSYFHADRTPRTRGWWFWRQRPSSSLGWELGLYGDYHYSEDLVIRAGYAHFFGKRGLAWNSGVTENGLNTWPGSRSDNYHYLFIETEISF